MAIKDIFELKEAIADMKGNMKEIFVMIKGIEKAVTGYAFDHDRIMTMETKTVQTEKNIEVLFDKHKEHSKFFEDIREWKGKTAVYISLITIIIASVLSTVLSSISTKIFNFD
ncbi:hypothetical protein KJ628_06005 [Patescibacteria group bacterium]|nr:hypothetical protein [Patescibacteria group bacterium]